jgi:fructosamine-3-kinase
VRTYHTSTESWATERYVAQTLHAIGLDPGRSWSVSARKGHHGSARISSDRLDVFVKHGDGGQTSHETFNVERGVLQTLATHGLAAAVPELRGWGTDAYGRPVLATRYLADARSLLDHHEADPHLVEAVAPELGRSIARVHVLRAEDWPATLEAALSGRVPAGPTLVVALGLQAVSSDLWSELSAGSGELLGLAHADADVRDQARQAFAELTAPGLTTLVHGDLRPDHVLRAPDGALTLSDWETAHLGRPEEDLASLIAEWLLLELMGIDADAIARTDDGAFGSAAVAAVERVLPRIQALLAGYDAEGPRLDPRLLACVIGIATIGRLMAVASSMTRASMLQRSVLGLAMAMVTDADGFVQDLGLVAGVA